jgi:uncharacterized protein
MKVPSLYEGTMHSHTSAVLLVLAAVSFSTKASAAGFDCTKAKKPIEKMICADTEISRLDTFMSERYGALMKLVSGPQRDMLKDDQRCWLRERDFIRTKTELRASYQRRLASLDAKNSAIARWTEYRFGDYIVTHDAWMFDPDKNENVSRGLIGDEYSIHRVDDKTLSFTIAVTGRNGSECGTAGKASLSSDGKTYIAVISNNDDEEQSPSDNSKDDHNSSPCTIRIVFLKDHVNILPESGDCNTRCGAGASIGEVDLYPAQKTVLEHRSP